MAERDQSIPIEINANGDGVISLSELARYVQELVPQLSAKFGGAGRAAIAAAEPIKSGQTARFGSRGEEFTLTRRLPN